MPPVIRGVLILVVIILVLTFLWGCSVGIADVIVNGP